LHFSPFVHIMSSQKNVNLYEFFILSSLLQVLYAGNDGRCSRE
jgi:hypothetical protein